MSRQSLFVRLELYRCLSLGRLDSIVIRSLGEQELKLLHRNVDERLLVSTSHSGRIT